MVPCPALVLKCNQFMGGVDLMDALVALYRIHVRSKKILPQVFVSFLGCDICILLAALLQRLQRYVNTIKTCDDAAGV